MVKIKDGHFARKQPYEINDDFDCSNLGLTSLKGGSVFVDGDYECQDNKLTTLEGGPIFVGCLFDCDNNELTTLEGGPEEVMGDYDCGHNLLKSFKGIARKIGGGMIFCDDNPLLEDISQMPKKIWFIDVTSCDNIKKFTNKITNKDKLLTFKGASEEVIKRIKEWKYYDVVSETEVGIQVTNKSIGHKVIDNI